MAMNRVHNNKTVTIIYYHDKVLPLRRFQLHGVRQIQNNRCSVVINTGVELSMGVQWGK